jgi:hypothetical protein
MLVLYEQHCSGIVQRVRMKSDAVAQSTHDMLPRIAKPLLEEVQGRLLEDGKGKDDR